MGRKPTYGERCSSADCQRQRYVIHSPEKDDKRLEVSRYCYTHYQADKAASNAARKGTAHHAPAPTGYTVAEAYALWAVNSIAEFWYKRKQVYGIKLCAAGYTLVLAGADEALWVAETTRLEGAP